MATTYEYTKEIQFNGPIADPAAFMAAFDKTFNLKKQAEKYLALEAEDMEEWDKHIPEITSYRLFVDADGHGHVTVTGPAFPLAGEHLDVLEGVLKPALSGTITSFYKEQKTASGFMPANVMHPIKQVGSFVNTDMPEE